MGFEIDLWFLVVAIIQTENIVIIIIIIIIVNENSWDFIKPKPTEILVLIMSSISKPTGPKKGNNSRVDEIDNEDDIDNNKEFTTHWQQIVVHNSCLCLRRRFAYLSCTYSYVCDDFTQQYHWAKVAVVRVAVVDVRLTQGESAIF